MWTVCMQVVQTFFFTVCVCVCVCVLTCIYIYIYTYIYIWPLEMVFFRRVISHMSILECVCTLRHIYIYSKSALYSFFWALFKALIFFLSVWRDSDHWLCRFEETQITDYVDLKRLRSLTMSIWGDSDYWLCRCNAFCLFCFLAICKYVSWNMYVYKLFLLAYIYAH
jgi:hypothetical protein